MRAPSSKSDADALLRRHRAVDRIGVGEVVGARRDALPSPRRTLVPGSVGELRAQVRHQRRSPAAASTPS